MKSISGKNLCKVVERNGWTLRRILKDAGLTENDI